MNCFLVLVRVQQLMAKICALGRLPQHVRGSEDDRVAERSLAKRLQIARIAGLLSADDEVELEGIGGALRPDDAQQLMEETRALGRVPQRVLPKNYLEREWPRNRHPPCDSNRWVL